MHCGSRRPCTRTRESEQCQLCAGPCLGSGSVSQQAVAVEIRESWVSEVRQKAGALIAEHFAEIATHKASKPLDPDWAAYERAEQAGDLLVLAAFAGEEMVGYALTRIGMHIHSRELLTLHNSALFVGKEHRAGGVGVRLIRATEDCARSLQRKCFVSWHAKPDTALAAILPRLGYALEDLIFVKEV